MKLGILTGVETRHRYFVQTLKQRFDVTAVGYEQTGYHPGAIDACGLSAEESGIVAAYFERRAFQEERFFGAHSDLVLADGRCAVLDLNRETLNTSRTLAFLESAGVDTLVVYGTDLIKAPLLGRWPQRTINMHLGLSPYYRGTATNFYPLLNEEPQYVGATIHLIDAGIDAGPIFAHARPDIVADDEPHTIGCKAIAAGVARLIRVLDDLSRDVSEPVPQWPVPNERFYLRKDYHPRQVVALHRKMEEGLIRRYVNRAAQGATNIRLIG